MQSGALTSLPIRKKLLLLFLCVFLPVLGIVAIMSWNDRQGEIARAKDRALLVARSLAAQQEEIVTGARQLLSTLAQFPEVQRIDVEACSRLFHRLHQQNPSYSNISMATPDGMLVAASIPFEPGTVNLADRRHIKEAVRTLDFSAGEYVVGRISKTQSLNYTYPVLDQNRRLLGIVIAAFRLNEYTQQINEINMPEDSAVTIVDHRGIRLIRWPEHESAGIGKPIPREVFEKAASNRGSGIYENISDDGVKRIYAFKPMSLQEDTPPYLYVFVGLSKQRVMREANTRLALHLIILGFGGLGAAVLAWHFTDSLVIKPVQSLASTAKQFGEGQLNIRTGLPHSADELGQLARSFDQMATLLEIREKERRRAEEDWEKTFDAVSRADRHTRHQPPDRQGQQADGRQVGPDTAGVYRAAML